MTSSWPARLENGDLVLRPLKVRDYSSWREVRMRNQEWLAKWDATSPRPNLEPAPTFRQSTRKILQAAKTGHAMPFVLEYKGNFVGQLNVSDIVTGSLWSCHIGYWIDERVANRGLMTTALALVCDHLFFTKQLHRIEIAIRPENEPSNRLVQRLGFRYEGLRKSFLHIDGNWCDHNIYVLMQDEVTKSMLTRIKRQ